MKYCHGCTTLKEYTDFNKWKYSKDGYGSQCRECNKQHCKNAYKRNPKKYIDAGASWRASNRELDKQLKTKWRNNNRQLHNKICNAYYCANKALIRQKAQIYSKLYPENNRASTARYNAAKLNAYPAWLNLEQIQLIKDIYKNKPEGYHVDHIVPLRGKEVSGLHVPWNLQYLPAIENIKKSNKLI